MNVNLLRFNNFSWPHKNKLWLIFAILCSLLLIFLWQLREANLTIASQQNLNQRLQIDLQKLQISYKQLNKQRKDKKKLNPVKKTLDATKLGESLLEFESIKVIYANASEIVGLIKDKENLLTAQGGVFADNRTNTILVHDNFKRVQKIKQIIKSLDTPQRQVLIEARVVNIERNSAEDLGVRFGFMQAQAKKNLVLNDDSQAKPSHLGFDLSALPLEANPASIGLALATLGKTALLDLELSALQSEGKAEIIASPRLITANQEPAFIESGEDIPYQKISANGITSVAFKKAVLSLKVVPKITLDDKLIMSIAINQDTDSGRRVQGIPIISTKALETKVMIDDNQTIVLGGIYKQDKNHSIIRVPILGTLPILRFLFRRIEHKLRNEELLIFITPQIVAWP